MTDAIVTDLAEYKAQKGIPVLGHWTDEKIRSHYKVLRFIEGGATYLTDTSNPLAALQWPDGFDPENHPSDNIQVVRDEAARRGVKLT